MADEADVAGEASVAHDSNAVTGALKRTSWTQFAVTNLAELLERTAYYGFVSVFALYLDHLHFTAGQIGAFSAFLLAVPYCLPLVISPIAEKFGYKPIMLAALACYSGGFVVVASTTAVPGIWAGLTLVALGAGGFKPLATATIAHVTAPEQRSFGYTIYYTAINVGGFLGPLVLALAFKQYSYGFLLAAAVMGLNLVMTTILYRSPQPPQRETSIVHSLSKLGSIFQDRALLFLLLTFSGFWFLYSMNFSFLSLYIDRFVDIPTWATASLQQSYNPLIIIVLGIPIASLSTKADPRKMMTAGVLLYVIGFAIVGFIPHIMAFFVGLFIATVGEILAYPAFLAFIANIAPKDRVAVYQSFGFVPIFLGYLLGPLVCGPFYKTLAEDQNEPALFWVLPLTVGVLSLMGFLFAAARRRVEPSQRRKGYAMAAASLLLIPVLLGLAVVANPLAQPIVTTPVDEALLDRSGYLAEGAATTVPVDVPAGAGNITVRLTWTDPVAGTRGASNAPDSFKLEVLNGTRVLSSAEGKNAQGGPGQVVVRAPSPGIGTSYTVRITLTDAGDETATLPLAGGVTVAQDTGNSWHLVVEPDPSLSV